MNSKEFETAWQIALSNVELADFDDGILVGCGLNNFEPVKVTVEVVAKFLRWQCLPTFGGEEEILFDGIELEKMRKVLVSSQKVKIVMDDQC